MSQELSDYEREVTRKFPCPVGYRELTKGEAVERVFDRCNLRQYKLLSWDDPNVITTQVTVEHENGLVVSQSAVWFVAKVQVGWIIDKDCLADESAKAPSNSNAVGMIGPRGYTGDGSDCVYKFRMLDDDNEVYYEGRCNKPDSFAPLNDFGMPNAGATMIQYRQELTLPGVKAKSAWVTL